VIQVVERVRNVDLIGLEEGVQRLACRQAQQTTQFRLREPPQPKLLDRERLQNAAGQIADGPKSGRQIVGNVNGHVHRDIFTGTSAQGQKHMV
jgi:hypothetical protein